MKSWNMEDQLCPSGSKAEMSLPENKPSALVPGCVREPGEMEVNTDASFSSNLQYFTHSHLMYRFLHAIVFLFFPSMGE